MWRWLLAIAAVPVPIFVAVFRYLLPYDGTDTPEQIFAKLVARPATRTRRLAGHPVVLCGFAGALAVAWLTRRRTPVLTTIAMALAVPGYLALFAGGSFGDLLSYVTRTVPGMDYQTAFQLGSGMESSPQSSAPGLIFVAGHLFGTTLLGIALWRARIAPTWLAIGLTVSQPIHLASVMTGIRPLDLLGWGLTAVGFAWAAWRLSRLPNDEFDLPPLRRRSSRSPTEAGPAVGRPLQGPAGVSRRLGEPCRLPRRAPRVALSISQPRTWAGDASGWTDRYSAAAPLTSGAAQEVATPSEVTRRSGSRNGSTTEVTASAGAKRSTHRPWFNPASRSDFVEAATVITRQTRRRMLAGVLTVVAGRGDDRQTGLDEPVDRCRDRGSGCIDVEREIHHRGLVRVVGHPAERADDRAVASASVLSSAPSQPPLDPTDTIVAFFATPECRPATSPATNSPWLIPSSKVQALPRARPTEALPPNSAFPTSKRPSTTYTVTPRPWPSVVNR